MNLKRVGAATALVALASGAVAAAPTTTTTNWVVHDNPAETATMMPANGSFEDYFLFSIPAGFDLVGSVTVSNNLTITFTPPPSIPPLVVFQIEGGKYSLWSDAGMAGPGGGDTQIGGVWDFDGTTGSTVNTVSVAPGASYYYKVWGEATGSNGGLYTITSAIVPIPEPETYALMLAGLGVVGFVAGRRRARG